MTDAYRPLPALTPELRTAEFRSGADELDTWLTSRALKAQELGNASTFVFAHQGRVLGYYALAAGAIEREAAPGPVRRNAPQPIPVVLLARLAVDRVGHGRGIGRRLLQDALVRALAVSEQVGFRALLVHSRDELARRFYLRHVPAFVPSPTEELHLLLPLQQVRQLVSRPDDSGTESTSS